MKGKEKKRMFNDAGKTALITGASSGIREAFAQILAACGMNLVLVARSAEKLRALAQALSEQHGIRADVVPADLCREGAVQEVYRRTQTLGVAVDLLVNNAGFGTYGGFDTLAQEREHGEIMLNVTALVDLTHAFVPAIGVFLSLVPVVGLLIWYILIARKLFMLAQGVSNEEAH